MPTPVPSPLRSSIHWLSHSHLRLLVAGLVAIGLIAAVSTFAAGDFESGEEQTMTIELPNTEVIEQQNVINIEAPPYTPAQIAALKNQVEKYADAAKKAKEQLATAQKNNKPGSVKVAQQKLNEAQKNLENAKKALAAANGKLDEYNKKQQQKQPAGQNKANGRLSFITSEPNVSVTFKCTGGENKTVRTNGSGQAGPFNVTGVKPDDKRDCWTKVGIPEGYQLVEGNKREVTKTVKSGQSVSVKWNFEPTASTEETDESDGGTEGTDTGEGDNDSDQDTDTGQASPSSSASPTDGTATPGSTASPSTATTPDPNQSSDGTQGGGSDGGEAKAATLPASGTETMAIVLTFLALAAIYYGSRKYLLRKRGK